MGPRDRARIILHIGKKIAAQSTEIASIESQDSGGTIRKTMGDLTLCGVQLRAFAGMGTKFPYVEQLPLQEMPGLSQNSVLRLLSPTAPFGDYKQSGIGREFGWHGLSEYLQIKHIHIDNVDNLGKKFWYTSLFG